MKYEIKNAENSILKTLVVIVFYILALLISMFLFTNIQHEETIINNKILNYLCYPIYKEYLFDENLLYIFNNMYFLLYFVIFYIYEHLCIHNNIATRYNTKKWILHKYIIGIGVILILSLIEYGCIYYVFKSAMPHTLKYYLYPFIYKVLIMSYVYTLYNTFKTNKGIFLILLIPACISLYYFNLYMYIVIIISTLIFNYLFFDLRMFKYKFIGIKVKKFNH